MAVKPTLTDVSLAVLRQRLATLNNRNFNFVFLGDTWFDWGDMTKQNFMKARDDAILRFQIFLSCLQAASKLTPKPLFVLYGGDAVRSRSVAQLTYFRDTTVNFVKKSKLPFFMVPGNHERNGVGGPLTDYQNIIGPRKGNQAVSENQLNYLLNTPNLRMIMLNDVGPVSGGKTYGITPSALATFEQGIRTNKRVLVVMHVPPKTGSFRNFSSSDAFPVTTAADKKFIADLRTAKNVKLVLVSHIHDKLLKGQIAGKTAVLNGNGGAGLDTRPTPHPAIASFTFLRSTNSIRFNGQKAVKVNRNLRPNKVFITTQGGTITVPIP